MEPRHLGNEEKEELFQRYIQNHDELKASVIAVCDQYLIDNHFSVHSCVITEHCDEGVRRAIKLKALLNSISQTDLLKDEKILLLLYSAMASRFTFGSKTLADRIAQNVLTFEELPRASSNIPFYTVTKNTSIFNVTTTRHNKHTHQTTNNPDDIPEMSVYSIYTRGECYDFDDRSHFTLIPRNVLKNKIKHDLHYNHNENITHTCATIIKEALEDRSSVEDALAVFNAQYEIYATTIDLSDSPPSSSPK